MVSEICEVIYFADGGVTDFLRLVRLTEIPVAEEAKFGLVCCWSAVKAAVLVWPLGGHALADEADGHCSLTEI